MEPRNLTGLNPTLEEIEINLKAGAVAAKKSAHSAIIMARGRIALPDTPCMKSSKFCGSVTPI